MSEHIRTMIDNIQAGDLVAAKVEFDSALASKMSDAMDSRRIEIASNAYNAATSDFEVETAEIDLEGNSD